MIFRPYTLSEINFLKTFVYINICLTFAQPIAHNERISQYLHKN